MKFILIGQHSPEWALRSETRSRMAFSKIQELGLSVESSYYTQGRHDYVTIVESPDAETVSRFSIWYAAQGFGRVETMRGYDSKEMNAITSGLDVDARPLGASPAIGPHNAQGSLEQTVSLPVFESYTQTELDLQYNPRLAVKDFPALATEWQARSRAARERLRCTADISYGATEMEKLDIFRQKDAGAPIVIFFHGGYWRSGDKSDFSFIAQGLVESGAAVVIPNYALCPHVTLDELVGQCYRAIRWVDDNASEFGGDPSRIHLAGHSAGGHIVALAMTRGTEAGLPEGMIKSGLSISGLYNLEPLRRSFLNMEVRLTPEQVLRLSPIGHLRRIDAELALSVGADESHEFHRQTNDYRREWERCGNSARYLPVAGADHYSVLDSLADSGGVLCQAMVKTMSDGVRAVDSSV